MTVAFIVIVDFNSLNERMNKSGSQFLYFRNFTDSFQKQTKINGFLIGRLQFEFCVLNLYRQLSLLLFVLLHQTLIAGIFHISQNPILIQRFNQTVDFINTLFTVTDKLLKPLIFSLPN